MADTQATDFPSLTSVALATCDECAAAVLHRAFSDDGRFTVVGIAADADAAEALAVERAPAVLVADLALPPAGLVDVMPRLLELAPELCVLALVGNPFDDSWLQALRAGASGLATLPADLEAARVVAGDVLAMLEGETVLVPPAGKMLISHLRSASGPPRGLKPISSILTNREWEILELIAEGLTTEQIADHLVLSSQTVYSHVTHVLRKLGVHSRTEAVRVGMRLRAQEAGRNHPPRAAEPATNGGSAAAGPPSGDVVSDEVSRPGGPSPT